MHTSQQQQSATRARIHTPACCSALSCPPRVSAGHACGQASQFKLADMATSLEASRLMVRSAASALDAGSPRATLAAAMAKRFATDACFGVANDALQLLGGYGYLADHPVRRQTGRQAAHAAHAWQQCGEDQKTERDRECEREAEGETCMCVQEPGICSRRAAGGAHATLALPHAGLSRARRLSVTCGTCVCTASWKGPTRSCGSSSTASWHASTTGSDAAERHGAGVCLSRLQAGKHCLVQQCCVVPSALYVLLCAPWHAAGRAAAGCVEHARPSLCRRHRYLSPGVVSLTFHCHSSLSSAQFWGNLSASAHPAVHAHKPQAHCSGGGGLRLLLASFQQQQAAWASDRCVCSRAPLCWL